MISKDARFPVSEYYQQKEQKEEEKNTETSSQTQSVTYPKGLSSYYYENMRNNAEYKSKDWYLSFALESYANAVRKFYCSTMQALNNLVFAPINLPNYITQSSECEINNAEYNLATLQGLAKDLEEKELKLLESLSINRTTMSARCNKSATINELRNFAAKAWLVYDNLKEDKFFHSVVDFKSRNADKDMNVDRNIALVCTGHYKSKNYVKTKLKNYFSTTATKTPFVNKHGETIKLYLNLSAEDLFFNLMTMFNGYNYQENEEYITQLQQKVTDKKAMLVIDFYKNYADVKSVYKAVFFIVDEINNGNESTLDFVDYNHLKQTDQKRDVYLQAKIYLEKVNELYALAQEDEYSFLIKDCLHLKHKLTEAIKLIEPHHQKYLQRREENLKNFKKKFPDLNPHM